MTLLPTPDAPTVVPDERWERAFHTLCSALLDEAERRDWCDEYDEFVANVNRELPSGATIPDRTRTVEVRLTCTLPPGRVSELEAFVDIVLNEQFDASPCTDFRWERCDD